MLQASSMVNGTIALSLLSTGLASRQVSQGASSCMLHGHNFAHNWVAAQALRQTRKHMIQSRYARSFGSSSTVMASMPPAGGPQPSPAGISESRGEGTCDLCHAFMLAVRVTAYHLRWMILKSPKPNVLTEVGSSIRMCMMLLFLISY